MQSVCLFFTCVYTDVCATMYNGAQGMSVCSIITHILDAGSFAVLETGCQPSSLNHPLVPGVTNAQAKPGPLLVSEITTHVTSCAT